MKIKNLLCSMGILGVLTVTFAINIFAASDNYAATSSFSASVKGSYRSYTKKAIGNNDKNYRCVPGSEYYYFSATPKYNVTLYKYGAIIDTNLGTVYSFPTGRGDNGTNNTYCGRWTDVNANPSNDKFSFQYWAVDNYIYDWSGKQVGRATISGSSTLLSE